MHNSIYSAGSNPPFNYNVKIDLDPNIRETKATMITRFIELWCELNCMGRWRVDEYQKFVDVSFDEVSDVVLFKLSPEYSLS